jgi:hypothetical protein
MPFQKYIPPHSLFFRDTQTDQTYASYFVGCMLHSVRIRTRYILDGRRRYLFRLQGTSEFRGAQHQEATHSKNLDVPDAEEGMRWKTGVAGRKGEYLDKLAKASFRTDTLLKQ